MTSPCRRLFPMLTLALAAVLLCAFSPMPVFAQDDIAKHPKCPLCGMDRQQFNYSRVYVTYDDGSTYGTCSIHCAAMDLALSTDKTPKSIMVGDYNTKALIDAEKAFWVIGGAKPGVMTKRAKWAFVKKEDAQAFIKASGGQLGTFEEAMKATYEDMYADSRMIREKRKMRKQQQQKTGS